MGIPWTKSEDEKLLKLASCDDVRWDSVAAQMPNRNRNACASRYYKLRDGAVSKPMKVNDGLCRNGPEAGSRMLLDALCAYYERREAGALA